MTPEQDGVLTVAALMALSARTAPKGKGMDSVEIKVISGNELGLLSDAMKEGGSYLKLSFFHRDSKNVADSDACVLIGARAFEPVGINCRGCGHSSCSEMSDAYSRSEKAPFVFRGPNCSIKMTDLGIAVGSAVKTASVHNVDNRVMYSAGIAALSLGWLGDCSVAYGIPLKASGKNIFFDRS